MSTEQLKEAVFLFADDGATVAHEMLYSEFDAILSGVARLESHANQLVEACFTVINAQLELKGIAFFLLRINGAGEPEGFNIPLRQLVRQSEKVEVAGLGHVRVASRGRCPIPWQVVNLWEPKLDATYTNVVAKVRKNKLGLYFERREPLAIQQEPWKAAVEIAPPQPKLPSDIDPVALQELEVARQEITRLRTALRHEQERNRRLQDKLLNGG